MNRSLRLMAVLSLVALGAVDRAFADQPGPHLRSRRDFASAMGKLDEGMSARRVLELLGPPDDTISRSDPRGIYTVGTREIWRYGTSGHHSAATLGQVYIDESGSVQYVYGGRGSPPPQDMFSETELRNIINVLAEVPSYNAGSHYDPLKVIRAVNLLQPLGRGKTLAAIGEFLRVSSDFDDPAREGMFLVLRTLFEVPSVPGYFPRMLVGAPDPSEPNDPKLLPRFPIALVDDVPLLVVEGYSLGGLAEPPEDELDYFRRDGKLRATQLAPTSTPIAALEHFIKSPQWFVPKTNRPTEGQTERDMLREQILRMLSSVYRVEPDSEGNLLRTGCDGDTSKRDKILTKAAELRIRWNLKLDKYTFLDGTSLPAIQPNDYPREHVNFEAPGSKIEITLQRADSRFVDESINEHGVSNKPVKINIWDVAAMAAPIATSDCGASFKDPAGHFTQVTASSGGNEERVSGSQIALAETHQIIVEAIVDGKSVSSPILKP